MLLEFEVLSNMTICIFYKVLLTSREEKSVW